MRRRATDDRMIGVVRVASLVVAVAACGGTDGSPLEPVERAIAAARDGDPAGLRDLCDPEGAADSDARRVCGARPERTREWQIFRTWLGDARILGLMGHAGVATDDEVNIAVAMGPDQRHVEFTVVRRGERWYLLRF